MRTRGKSISTNCRAQLAVLLTFGTLARSSLAAQGAPICAVPSIQLALVGQIGTETSLFGRVRSLFAQDTQFALETAAELDSQAVLVPKLPGRLYIWITHRDHERARVYVAEREAGAGATHYLYRDVVLESGLDEIGAETLALVAHSSACALWTREQQVPRTVVVGAMQTESALAAQESVAVPVTPATSNESSTRSRHNDPAPVRVRSEKAVRVGVTAEYSGRASGGEGWLHEPGAGVFAVAWGTLRFHLGAAYTVPHAFDLQLTRVRVRGPSTEFRVGYVAPITQHIHARLDAGLGVFFAYWVAEAHPPAVAASAQDEQRAYALTSLGLEQIVAGVSVAARAQLRVPFQTTSYEVAEPGRPLWKTEAWLSPGFAVEVGLPIN